MAANIKFEDNRIEVKGSIDKAVMAFLHEISGEVVAKTQDNSRVDSGQTKNSYTYNIEQNAAGAESKIGSPLENAIWEEFGTGEYALHGDGRKGGWFYEDEKGEGHFTRGKTPNRPLFNAFTTLKPKIKKRAQEVIGAKMK